MQLQNLFAADGAKAANQVIDDARQFVDEVGRRAAVQDNLSSQQHDLAFLSADNFPQDTVRIVDSKIWKVGTADSGGKYWVPVYVPTCGFPANLVQEKRKVLETGYGKQVIKSR